MLVSLNARKETLLRGYEIMKVRFDISLALGRCLPHHENADLKYESIYRYRYRLYATIFQTLYYISMIINQ